LAERWAINASPLIVLAKIGSDSLLTQLADAVVIPRAVAVEIDAGPKDYSARQVLTTGVFTVVETPPASNELLAWDLGAGETAVLAYALSNPGWKAIVDDGLARRCARAFSVPVLGTLGIVLLARQRNLIPSAADMLRQLRAGGFHLNDNLVREALRRAVGELW
jgi:predicted nucleic acid-binding protein